MNEQEEHGQTRYQDCHDNNYLGNNPIAKETFKLGPQSKIRCKSKGGREFQILIIRLY